MSPRTTLATQILCAGTTIASLGYLACANLDLLLIRLPTLKNTYARAKISNIHGTGTHETYERAKVRVRGTWKEMLSSVICAMPPVRVEYPTPEENWPTDICTSKLVVVDRSFRIRTIP